MAYECHGPHFGCVVKHGAKADGKTLFGTFDECATACHAVPKELSFGSRHTQGVNMGFADGHIRFVPETVDRAVWSALGTRSFGETDTNLE